jgi:threonine/homoserine/homoserine lactone efflux protein
MGAKQSTAKPLKAQSIMLIWVIVGVIMGFLMGMTALIPGVNFVGVPIVVGISSLVHVVFFVWLAVRAIEEMQKSGFTNYERGKHKIK